jgi:hypothetical protein
MALARFTVAKLPSNRAGLRGGGATDPISYTVQCQVGVGKTQTHDVR